MKRTEILPNIFHVETKTNRELATMFMRFQEHYESPKFRDKVFTIKAFKEYYRKQFGKFSYVSDWTGFNIPSYVLEPFYRGDFKRLTLAERYMLDQFREIYKRHEPFYIIGTSKENVDVLDHEIAHGMWYTDPNYRAAAQKIIRAINPKPVFRWLLSKGYHKAVLEDEANSYLTHEAAYLRSQGININAYVSGRHLLRDCYLEALLKQKKTPTRVTRSGLSY